MWIFSQATAETQAVRMKGPTGAGDSGGKAVLTAKIQMKIATELHRAVRCHFIWSSGRQIWCSRVLPSGSYSEIKYEDHGCRCKYLTEKTQTTVPSVHTPWVGSCACEGMKITEWYLFALCLISLNCIATQSRHEVLKAGHSRLLFSIHFQMHGWGTKKNLHALTKGFIFCAPKFKK